MDRADIDDPAAATRGDHVAGGGLGGQERRGDVDRERLLEELLAERLEGRHLRRDGGVVDEDVDPPEPLDRGVDDAGSQARVLVRSRPVAVSTRRPMARQAAATPSSEAALLR